MLKATAAGAVCVCVAEHMRWKSMLGIIDILAGYFII